MEQILNILGSVGFNWHVALANFVNFLIILYILNKFFFRKLGKTIDDRKSVIDRGLAQASEAEKALAKAEEKKKEIIHTAKRESHAIIEEAKVQAEELASSIRIAAEEDIASKRQDLASKEAKLRQKVEKDLSEEAPFLVAKLYAHTLRKNLTEKDNNELIERMK
jgi:F-type H+-transporting ATPase subunit b